MTVTRKRRHQMQPWTSESELRADLVPLGMDLLAIWIRESRRYLGYTQTRLATESGISQSTISRLENAKSEGLRLHRLVVLLVLLNDGLDVGLRASRRERATALAIRLDTARMRLSA